MLGVGGEAPTGPPDTPASSGLLVSRETFDDAELFLAQNSFEQPVFITVKGANKPLAVYAPTAEIGKKRSDHSGRRRLSRAPLARSLSPSGAPLIASGGGVPGRAAELEYLTERAARLFRHRHGGLVIVDGQEGIGKSFVLDALVQQSELESCKLCVGCADALVKNHAFQAFQSIFEAALAGIAGSREDAILSLLVRDLESATAGKRSRSRTVGARPAGALLDGRRAARSAPAREPPRRFAPARELSLDSARTASSTISAYALGARFGRQPDRSVSGPSSDGNSSAERQADEIHPELLNDVWPGVHFPVRPRFFVATF